MEIDQDVRRSYELRSQSHKPIDSIDRQVSGFKSHPVRIKKNPKFDKDIQVINGIHLDMTLD